MPVPIKSHQKNKKYMIGQNIFDFYIFAPPQGKWKSMFFGNFDPVERPQFFKTYFATFFLYPIKLFERVRRQKFKTSKINGQSDMYQDRIWTEIFSNGTASNEGRCENKNSKFCF